MIWRTDTCAVMKSVGSTRVGVVEVDFQQETEGENYEACAFWWHNSSDAGCV
jgi:hypothetical protein